MSELRLVQFYYLGTPLFLLLDVLLGLDLRAAFLEQSGARVAWYALCTGLGLIAWRIPTAAPFLGLVESALNFLLLCLAVMLPIMAPMLEDGGPAGLYGTRLLAFLLIGGMCITSFHLAMRQLHDRRADGR